MNWFNMEIIMCKRLILLTILIMFLTITQLIGNTFEGVEIIEGTWRGENVEYLKGEILVKLSPGVSEQELLKELNQLPVEMVSRIDTHGFAKLYTWENENIIETIDIINQFSIIEYASLNTIQYAQGRANDPYVMYQWYLYNDGYGPAYAIAGADINVSPGWAITTGSPFIKIAILDSGIPIVDGELSHPDLDDSTRFIMGHNFISNNEIPRDDSGHGTHVTGILGAESNNSIGVAGICWQPQILEVKVFNQNGQTTDEIWRNACIYAVDYGCKVINYSGGGPEDEDLEYGVNYANDHDVLIVAAAGNDAAIDDGHVRWPAAYSSEYDNVMAISATNHRDSITFYSNRGPEINVCAYNVELLENYPELEQNYTYLAGTSMATPQVSALAGLIYSIDPFIVPDSVISIIESTADDLGDAGKDNLYGWGRINVGDALEAMIECPLPMTENWDKTFSNDYYEEATSIIQTSDSGYITVGRNFDAGTNGRPLIIKSNACSQPEWIYQCESIALMDIIQNSNDDYLITGYISGNGADIAIMELSDQGILDTIKQFNYTGDQIPTNIIPTNDGGCAIVGIPDEYSGNGFIFIKLDSQYDSAWGQAITIRSGFHTEPSSVMQLQDGSYIVAGDITKYPDSATCFLAKLDQYGSLVWQQTYFNDTILWAARSTNFMTDDGGFVIIGQGTKVLKTDEYGNKDWITVNNTAQNATAFDISPNGGFLVSGTASYIYDVPPQHYFSVLNPKGIVVQDSCTGYGTGNSIQKAFDDGTIIALRKYYPIHPPFYHPEDYQIIKLSYFPDYICGDANADGVVNVSDAVYMVAYVFEGGPEPVPFIAGNANCDSNVNVSDAVYLINYVFSGGAPPCDTNNDGIPDC